MMLCRLKVEGQTLRWYGGPEVLAADSIEFVGFEFILPEDWDGYTLHATFQQDDKAYTQVLEDRKCTLPSEIGVGNCGIGLFGYQPGKSPRATTNLLNVQVVPSGFIPDGESPVPPTPDLYSQLLQRIESQVVEAQSFSESAEDAAKRAEEAAKQAESAIPAGSLKLGNGLKWEADGRVSVDTAEKVEKDNTLPVTSAAVHVEIGNIEALLAAL